MKKVEKRRDFLRTTIPMDWSVAKLDDCLELLTDFEANGSFADVKENVRVYDNFEYAWYVRATDLENESRIDEVKYVDKKTYNFLRKTKLSGGEVLITKRGEIGKVYLFEKKTDFATVAPNLYLLKLNEKAIPYFLYSFFKAEIGNRELRKIDSSSTLGALYKDDVKALKIPLPPLPEQKVIAQVLCTADAAIHTTEKLIAQKELRKKWLMQQLLTGKKRLKGFEGEWKQMMLGDIGEIKTSSVDKVFLEEERIVNLVNYMDVYKNRFITPEFECKKTSANEREINTFNLRKGDILFTPSSETPDDIGHSAVVTADLENTVYSYHLVRFRLFQETTLSYNFRAYVFNNQNILNEFSRRATGSTRFTISKSDFEEIETKIPPTLEEQTAIAQVLQVADKEISLLKTKAEKLREQKKGLMQQLLTGKKRIKV